MSLGFKILAGLLLLLALVGAYKGWEDHVYQHGWDDRDAQAKAEAIEIEHDMQKKHDTDVAAAKADTDKLRLKIETEMTTRVAVEKKYADLQERHQAALRAGTERLRIAVASCAVSPGTAPGNHAAASGVGAETRADVMPETAADLVGVGAISARDVRDYNRLVDLYNAARETCGTEIKNGNAQTQDR